MVKYKLALNIKGEKKIIDLDNIIGLKDLKSIDEFTSEFSDENSLKVYLFNQALLNELDLNHEIVVVYKNNGKSKKIPVIYHDAKKLLDIMYLISKIKSMGSDLEFLEKLANYYDNGSTNYNKQGINVMDIRKYLSDVRSNGGKIFFSNTLYIALDNLVKKATFRVQQSTGEVVVNYRGLRDLALFVHKYETKKGLSNNSKSEKAREMWEQPTLFDLVENEERRTLSSDGDPDFPYNSEEEDMYLKYEESLPDEFYEDDEHISHKR